jgi:hypothetical protein
MADGQGEAARGTSGQVTNSKSQIPNKGQSHFFYSFVCYFEFRSRAAQALAPRVVICLIFVNKLVF